jgi:hypothetical protein
MNPIKPQSLPVEDARMPKEIHIFISHSSKTAKLGERFKQLLQRYRLRPDNPIPDVFLSSDASSITTGDLWVQVILDKLSACTHFVALITSEEDWRNPWISFEMGHFIGQQRGLFREEEQYKACRKRPTVIVFSNLIEKKTPPLDLYQVITAKNAARIQDALLDMKVGPWSKEFEKEFLTLFKRRGRIKKEAKPKAI